MNNDYNPEQFDSICGWCENVFSGPVDRQRVDGEMMDLCPDCSNNYGECEACGKKRPGIVHCDEVSACGECRTDTNYQELDEEYERAAVRARSNDFEDTDRKDWT